MENATDIMLHVEGEDAFSGRGYQIAIEIGSILLVAFCFIAI